MKEITVLRVNAGEKPELVTVDNTLQTLQNIVGGNLETVAFMGGIHLVMNKERSLHKKGNVFFTGKLNGELISLNKAQVKTLLNLFN